MNELSAKPSLARPRSALAILAICASLLLAAAGVNLTSAPSGTTTQIVRDPENPAYVGNTIDQATAPSHASQIVRDPEDPY